MVEVMDKVSEIRLSGTGGQGLILGASMLANALIKEGRTVAQSQSYEPTSRGGLSRSDLVVSDGPIDYPLVNKLDYLVILDQVAVQESEGMIGEDAIIITDLKTVSNPPKGKIQLIQLPILETALALGNRRIANVIALAALTSMGDLCDYETLKQIVIARSPKAFVDLNQEALDKGWQMVANNQAA